MSDFELMFQLFALLLGLAMAELLTGLARCWRIRAGPAKSRRTDLRLGKLTPLLVRSRVSLGAAPSLCIWLDWSSCGSSSQSGAILSC